MIFRNSFLAGWVLLAGCQVRHGPQTLHWPAEAGEKLWGPHDKVMVLSCIRCGCFMSELPRAWRQDSTYFRQLWLVADTGCTRLPFLNGHVSQKELDGLSDELYNLVLIKREGNQYTGRIIETRESGEIRSICRRFFDTGK